MVRTHRILVLSAGCLWFVMSCKKEPSQPPITTPKLNTSLDGNQGEKDSKNGQQEDSDKWQEHTESNSGKTNLEAIRNQILGDDDLNSTGELSTDSQDNDTSSDESGFNDNTSSLVNVAQIASMDDLASICNSQTPELKTQRISFEPSNGGCTWDPGPNDDRIRGYKEQTKPLDLPQGAVICHLAMKFIGNIEFEDELFLNLNKKVLIASQEFPNAFPLDNGVPTFNWSAVQDRNYSRGQYDAFCLGKDQGLTQCAVPTSMEPGTINLQFDVALTKRLGYTLLRANTLQFELVTIGDDGNSDCRHSGLDFDVEVSFLLSEATQGGQVATSGQDSGTQ